MKNEYQGGKFRPCYETHPAMPLGNGIEIYGGSCGHPVVKDADIYVGFDYSMARNVASYPWEDGESFLFHIQDMQVPADFDSYVKLIDWLAVQLAAKKKVHLGCIGGHGRTGTVLATLVKVMMGEKAAVEYVRKHYCQKAVESDRQAKFLHEKFGIDLAPGYKHQTLPSAPTLVYPARTQAKQGVLAWEAMRSERRTNEAVAPAPSSQVANPVASPSSIWGNVALTNPVNAVTLKAK